MLKLLNGKFRRLFCRLRWPVRRRTKPKIQVKKFGKTNSKSQHDANQESSVNGSAAVHPNGELGGLKSIRIATFNAALFSMAPAVPETEKTASFGNENGDIMKVRRSLDVNFRAKSANDRPKSILKQSPLHPNSMNGTDTHSTQQNFRKSKLRVSINLPDNEISLLRNRQMSFDEREGSSSATAASSSTISRILRAKTPLRSTASFSTSMVNGIDVEGYRSSRSVLEVLRELDADILALQDVKAEEEKAMKPLSDLAGALGMNYVFAESWAPEYGNAILSRWPISRWKVQKIFDDSDFRNVLKATIIVPNMGEVNFNCTLLDNLDENWRMKQYHEEIGKPTPKVEVMKFLKSKQYSDSKEFAGECESVVMIAKGQSVQGTCKYGTRVDYVLASPNSPYKFVPGSYSVFSSKGTSDHHIVKVDLVKEITSATTAEDQNATRKQRRQPKQKVVKIAAKSSPSLGMWKTQTLRSERY
ncbi:hypothetical protein I3842_07G099200 [Carya illinoinensis]|uniref:Endonuclease/exonuclease/phosphatase domain-containing protein n=1 Tax=Carya illinoinensis TaxID=32201 RepID=A0A922EIT8_CARIL|nr:hypothetical protein I3842_07G099200 [Carya illinoinensis]